MKTQITEQNLMKILYEIEKYLIQILKLKILASLIMIMPKNKWNFFKQ